MFFVAKAAMRLAPGLGGYSAKESHKLSKAAFTAGKASSVAHR